MKNGKRLFLACILLSIELMQASSFKNLVAVVVHSSQGVTTKVIKNFVEKTIAGQEIIRTQVKKLQNKYNITTTEHGSTIESVQAVKTEQTAVGNGIFSFPNYKNKTETSINHNYYFAQKKWHETFRDWAEHNKNGKRAAGAGFACGYVAGGLSSYYLYRAWDQKK